ncbi:putative PD-(D/E)XK family protein DUF4420 [Diaminobutyricimonas aerilata]|uniref:Putative PD-(D/E)XK family protein DUF4420 n=1 Tax=Diaminobutyricimonas aerilata TaxID=1162967 RepID=A0A2M9CM21_9MICO|nr:PD-(D/E)XK motif protein [Diaminobutyricimonas aerilata]PJJ72951.1 putative PD-(D/E)XK family protein DUF4420 [Diaminobutyricimonas aerilata]
MSIEKQLETGWAVLQAPRDRELEAFDLDLRLNGFPCRIALDRNGVRHLLIPISDIKPVTPAPRQNLEVSSRWLEIGGSVSANLDLSCPDGTLRREFDEVIGDVLESVRDAADVQAAALTCIERWRRLFRTSRFGALSPEARLGLYAELSVLLAGVRSATGMPVSAWRGPLRERHDFEVAGMCLEVKGVGANASAVTIHGLDQLESHDGRELELLLISVTDEPAGQSIDELIAEIRIATVEQAQFEALLALTGWTENLHADRYAIEGVRAIPMSDAVPSLSTSRLAGGIVPEGVDRVRYDLALNVLMPHGRPTTVDDVFTGVRR